LEGFCGLSCCCGKLNSTTKALSSQPIFGEGIDKTIDFFLIDGSNDF
jgi:hypothetical protein